MAINEDHSASKVSLRVTQQLSRTGVYRLSLKKVQSIVLGLGVTVELQLVTTWAGRIVANFSILCFSHCHELHLHRLRARYMTSHQQVSHIMPAAMFFNFCSASEPRCGLDSAPRVLGQLDFHSSNTMLHISGNSVAIMEDRQAHMV